VIFPLFVEFFYFLLAQFLGLFCAQRIFQIFLKTKKVFPQLSYENFSFFDFFLGFFLAVFLFWLILKFSKRKSFFKVIFGIVVFFGGEIFFEIFFGSSFAVFLVLLFLIFWAKNPPVWFHNFLIIFSVAGIGAVVGISLSPSLALILLLVLSVYDFFAVSKFKFPQKIIKSAHETQAVLGIFLPQNFSGLFFPLKKIKIGDKTQNFFVLGAGDIILPLIMSASFFPQGIEKSLLIVFFSFLGVIFSFILFLKLGRKPLPALVPIGFFLVIGFILVHFLKI